MAQVSLSGKTGAERVCAENVIDQGSLRPGENRRISETQVGLGPFYHHPFSFMHDRAEEKTTALGLSYV